MRCPGAGGVAVATRGHVCGGFGAFGPGDDELGHGGVGSAPSAATGALPRWRDRGRRPEIEHTVTVDALGVILEDDAALGDVLDALDAREELLAPAVSADLVRRAISVTVTVVATGPESARQIAVRALGEALVTLGLAETWMPAGARPVVIG